MRILLVILISLSLEAVQLNHKKILKEYNSLNEKQKETIIQAYKQGQLLESSAGVYLTGDNGRSSGLTHITIEKARELLKKSYVYKDLSSLSNDKLKTFLKEVPEFNLHLTMINFKINYNKWGTYKEAVKAHNGYNPYNGFYNNKYYHKFVNLLQVVKLVVKDNDIINN
jgi:DNA-binding phage protein